MPTHSIDAICSVPTSGKWVLVIGDVMLDRYLVGDVQRISPEAPIPVVALTERYHRAGGAANVASNVAGLGVRVGLVGVVGTDPDAQVLEDLLDANNIQSYIVPLVHRVTTVKTRIMSTRQQIVRVDEESLHSFTPEEKDILRNTITRALAGRPSMVLLSDYAKGVLDVELCVWILDQCASLGIPALADPRGNDYSKYKGVMGLTPNKKETIEACGLVDGESTENIEIIGAALRLRLTHGFEFLAVTRGAEGISFIDAQGCRHIPAEARQVFDVSGAGDTVIAVLAVGILGGLSSFEALQVANIAAGIVVGKIGTAAITQEELLHKMSPPHVISGGEKIQSLPHVLETLTRWRNEGSTIVFTNGCFDLLHAGHVAYLEESKKAGDKLIVGLNTDESVRALKGVHRPIVPQEDRARVLAGLSSVDAVILFNESTPLALVQAIMPDVLIKGSDYTGAQIVGADEVILGGGKVQLIDIVQGKSTTSIIEKVTKINKVNSSDGGLHWSR